jgi:hypothetical protein
MSFHTCPACQQKFWREPDETWKRVCLACWKRTKGQERPRAAEPPAPAAPTIPEEMLGRLIRLCHPDRHGGSEASTKATQWLLSQRQLSH